MPLHRPCRRFGRRFDGPTVIVMDLGDDWYAALGRMVAAAAELEGNTAYLAVRMTGLTSRRVLHEWRGSWEQHLQARGGVAKTIREIQVGSKMLARPEDQALAVAWIRSVREALDERNRHVHSITVVGIASDAFQPPKVGRLQPRTQVLSDPPSIDELGALTRDLARLASEALTIASHVDVDTRARQLHDEQRAD